MGATRRTMMMACAAAALAGAAGPAAASGHGWQTVADVGLAGLLASAAGATAYEHDWKGAEQLGLSLAATEAETWGLKHAFPERRPNGSDRRSFPSGHTSLSFAAAGYLQQRYGWEAGLPAAAVAGLVGFARVKSHDHHWYDVVAGAAIGEATAFLLTSKHDDKVQILPWADSHGAGFSLAARF
ncbi:phosphatase PAP2 family protein [Phenylobacterium sp.]|uniref:phosphatase PAP2 family protein n=1 Tax=Phenylobacterium sp. TaxID=1871053 RepID=UPI0025DACE0F|nr:phosphatase PAP2 family protein [Phenylobacterium sp.]